uniref:Uncharacterized protein n=1 Tax=Triticum urartu TaxID=4572 RepID=A0A8R7V6K2_TRIUA
MLGFVSSARRPHLISSRAPPSCNQPCLPAGDEQQHRQDSPASPEAVGFLRALAPCRTPCSTSASRACAIVPRRCRLSVHTAAPSSPARQRQVPVIAALLPVEQRMLARPSRIDRIEPRHVSTRGSASSTPSPSAPLRGLPNLLPTELGHGPWCL